jgi:diguanylate cyclase (GGDEF)-like protein
MAAQEALAEREELLRRITDAMPVGLIQIDLERRAVYHNARLLQILHASSAPGGEADLTISQEREEPSPSARSLLCTLARSGLAGFEAALERVLEAGADQDVEADVELEGCEPRRALMSLRALHRPGGEIGGAIVSVLDVTDSARAHEELQRRATFDGLTGCYNRSAILDMIERELAREDSSTTGVVYVDLDRFKPVNDRFGHAAGDELLAGVAERLRALTRRGDGVGRLGGDEFIMLLPDIRGSEVALRVAERVCGSLNGELELSVGRVPLSASVGVACAEAGSTSADELVKRADRAMYRSKQDPDCGPTLEDPVPGERAPRRGSLPAGAPAAA